MTGERKYLTYEDLKKRDLIDFFAKRWLIPHDRIIEIIRLCEQDFRFSSPRTNYVEYTLISEYVRNYFRIIISPRRIKYLYNAFRRHRELMEKLKRGGKIEGTYRDLVLRKG